jgi:uncharacterized protein HemX
MSDRGGVEKAVITAGLIAVGAGIVWLAVALGLGVWVGKTIRHAEVEEIEKPQQRRREEKTLLGVVAPRQPISS